MLKRFNPQKDITAFEVAVIVANVAVDHNLGPLNKQDIIFSQKQWDSLGDLQRHWADSPNG